MFHLQTFEFSPIQENTYLLYNEHNDCIIIDPGCYFEEEREMLASFIQSKNLNPVLLLNTHCHLDHVFGNKFVAEEYGLIPHIHPLEKKLLEYAPTSGLMYNLPFDNYTGELAYIDEGSILKVGEDELVAIFTPGHSPGSLSFYCKKQLFIISGDVLFQRSIGRTDLPGGDHATLIRSIKEKLMILPDETVVHSGHGPSTTVIAERNGNPYLKG
jgi:glyoxylase-like metal-dependent hydrolase (beta-lactamase superfamily II)